MAARTVPPSDELTRRLKAAQAYGGFSSVDVFADAVGISRATFFRMFRKERGLREMEARQITAVTGLPLDFFSADFSESLGPPELPPEDEPEEESDRPRPPPEESTQRSIPLLQSRPATSG